MGILGRINRVIKSNVNELLDKMSDPSKEVDLLIIEMEAGLKQAREELVAVTATSKRADMQVDRAAEEVDRWQSRAEMAVRAGDDELARDALSQKLCAEQELQRARTHQGEQHAHVGQLREGLKQLDVRLNEVKMRKASLKQRAKAAKEGTKGFSGTKAFDEFDRLEARISGMEEATELSSSMSDRDAATEAKFRQLEANGGPSEVDDALAALKRRLEAGADGDE